MTWTHLATALALATTAAAATPDTSNGDIHWAITLRADPTTVRLAIEDEGGHNRVSSDYRIATLSGLDPRRFAASGAPVSFTIARDPGTLICTGVTDTARRGAGTCRFAGNDGFPQALARRGIRLSSLDRLLDLTLLDVRLAEVDALIAAGLPPRSESDLLQAAALKVTGDYVRMLAAAGIRPRTMDEAVTCRAVSIDASFVRGLAAAGYTRLTVRQAVEMKAVGVTPAYAAAMNRAARVAGQ